MAGSVGFVDPKDIEKMPTTPKIDLPSAQVELNFPHPEVDVSVTASAEAELDVGIPEQFGIDAQAAGEMFDQKGLDSEEPELPELDNQLSGQIQLGAEMSDLPELDVQLPDVELDVEVPRQVDLDVEVPEEVGIDVEMSGQANIDCEVPDHVDVEVDVAGQVDVDIEVSGQVNLDEEFPGPSNLEIPEQEGELDHIDGSSNVSLSGEVDANAQHADVNLDDLALENAAHSDQDEAQLTEPQDFVDAGPQVGDDFGQEGVEEEVLLQQVTASFQSKPPSGPAEPDKEAPQVEPDHEEEVELRPRRPGQPRNSQAATKKQLKQQQKQQRKEQEALQKQQKQQRKQAQKEQKAMLKQQQGSGKKVKGSGGSFWSLFRRSKSYSLERASAAGDSDHNDTASISGTYRPASWLSETEPPSPTTATPTPTPPVNLRFNSLPRLPTSVAEPAAAAAASASGSASPQQLQHRGEFILAAPPDPDESEQLDTDSLASDRRLREPELASFRRSVQENLLTQRSSCEPHGGQSSFFRARSANSTSSSSGSSSERSLAADSTEEAAAADCPARGASGGARRLVTLR